MATQIIATQIVAATADAQAAKLSQKLPDLIQTAPAISSATDFRQALAVAEPTSTGTLAVPSTQAAETVLIAAQSVTAGTTTGEVQTASKNTGFVPATGARRAKRGAAEKPAATPAIATASQQIAAPPAVAGVAVLAVAGPGVAVSVNNIPASRTGLSELAATEPAVFQPAAPWPPTAIDTVSHKADLTISGTDSTKPNTPASAAAEKSGARSAVLPGIQLNVSAVGATNPSMALHAPVKAADIIRQIAAALPAGSLKDSSTTPALHISLSPETLGTITVKITPHASGDTAVTISASQPETLAALKHDAPNLNQILTNAGVPEANRQVDFQTIPVAPAQISAGLGNAGGQPTGGQSAGSGQPQQSGTTFASSDLRSASAPASNNIVQPRRNNVRTGVDVIA